MQMKSTSVPRLPIDLQYPNKSTIKQVMQAPERGITKLTLGATPNKTRNNQNNSSTSSIVNTPTRQHQSIFAKALNLTNQHKLYE
jgi:Tfp pilus assembly protein PilE